MVKKTVKIIQKIIEENHLTAYKLSEKVPLSTNTISKIIKNERRRINYLRADEGYRGRGSSTSS